MARLLCALVSAALLASGLLASPTAHAQLAAKAPPPPLAPRDSAQVLKRGQWRVGVFNPLEIGLTDRISLVTHPLLLVGAPNATARVRLTELKGWRLTAEGGLAVPYLGMTAALPAGLAGWFFPACKVTAHDESMSSTCDQAGFIVTPSLGAMASRGERHVTTLRAELAFGLPLTGELGRPLEHIPPADLLFAPATYGWRLRVGGRYDRALSTRMRLSGELNVYLVGASEPPKRNPLTVTAHVGFDIKVGARGRFTIGALLANSDQRRKVVKEVDGRPQRVPVRNTDLYPTIDYIWEGL